MQSTGGLAELVDALDSKSSSFGVWVRFPQPLLSLSRSRMDKPRNIGIIAGSGVYPSTFVRAARMAEPAARLIAVGFEGETDPGLEKEVDASRTDPCRPALQAHQVPRFRRRHRGRDDGQISPKNLFDLRPDLRILMMLARVKKRNAETLFGAIAGELAKDGITLLPATTFLEDHLPPQGHVAGPILKPRTLGDLEYGFEIAKKTSALDIGQAVVVRHGTVLAVEAFEGTNACIRRGGELGRKRTPCS